MTAVASYNRVVKLATDVGDNATKEILSTPSPAPPARAACAVGFPASRCCAITDAHEPVTDVDITATDMLTYLDQALHKVGMELCFAEMKGPAKDRLKRYGLFTAIGTENFFPTIGQAVDRYLAVQQVEWHDWDE